jgi:SAM-dependent methyltransferase
LNVAGSCQFIEDDVRAVSLAPESFDAAMFIYGQLSVFPNDDVRQLLSSIATALRPGGRLCVELLNPERIDKKQNSWWFTDDKGLWGEEPFLHLGERFWLEDQQMVIERFQTVDLESARLETVILCDQAYSSASMAKLMLESGFSEVNVFPAWDSLPLYDAQEWIVYVAKVAGAPEKE